MSYIRHHCGYSCLGCFLHYYYYFSKTELDNPMAMVVQQPFEVLRSLARRRNLKATLCLYLLYLLRTTTIITAILAPPDEQHKHKSFTQLVLLVASQYEDCTTQRSQASIPVVNEQNLRLFSVLLLEVGKLKRWKFTMYYISCCTKQNLSKMTEIKKQA